MNQAASQDQEAINDQLSDQYREAVGSVMSARKLYENACSTHGSESWAAEQAQDYLTRQIEHRSEMRERYDKIIDRRLKR